MSALLGGPVVVGVDGRPEGLDALALAERLASLDDEELVVVTAYPYAPLSSRILDGPTDATAAARALDEARRALGRRAAELVTVPGSSPGRTLHEVAEAREAAVIVVGSSSHGPAGRLVLGGVTAETLRRAPARWGLHRGDGRTVRGRCIGSALPSTDRSATVRRSRSRRGSQSAPDQGQRCTPSMSSRLSLERRVPRGWRPACGSRVSRPTLSRCTAPTSISSCWDRAAAVGSEPSSWAAWLRGSSAWPAAR